MQDPKEQLSTPASKLSLLERTQVKYMWINANKKVHKYLQIVTKRQHRHEKAERFLNNENIDASSDNVFQFSHCFQ